MRQKLYDVLRSRVELYTSGGLNDPYYEKASRGMLLTNLFTVFSSFLFLSLSFLALLKEEFFIGAVFVLFTFTAFANLVFLKITLKHKIASGVLISLLCLSAIFSLLSGGVDNTGLLTIFILPPILIFLRGAKTGGIILAVTTAILIIILFFVDPQPSFQTYTISMKIALVIYFFALSLFSFTHDLIREISTEKLEDAASHDPLTGLLNRREMFRYLYAENLRSIRYKRPFSLIMCDIDNFKRLNDLHGHQFGDSVLKIISVIFRSDTRVQEHICRWGGEEFVFLLPETGLSGTMVVAERLRKKIFEEQFISGTEELTVTMSFGIGEYDTDLTIEENIDCVDKALYEAKHCGKNCIKTAIKPEKKS